MRRLIYLGIVLALVMSFASIETVQADRLPGSDQGGRPLTAVLLGPNEVPPAPSTSHGTATITINLGQAELCYVIEFTTTETVIAAHVHHAPAGVAAPPLIPLNAPVAGSSSGCKEVDQGLLKDILQNPEQYYVNVHTTVHPGGAGRGQLGK
jgi:hypothetical protein